MAALTISVVIPVYNDAPKLEKCLRSLTERATVIPEIVIVDDGSSDDPAAVAAKFGCRMVRLETNRGPAYARNRGVEACRGSIILFTDADCLVMPDWAATAAARLERIRLEFPQTAALYGRLDSGGNYVARAYAYTSYAYAQAGRAGFAEYLNTACAAVTREGFVRAGGFSEDMRVNEDPDLALKLIEAGYRVYFEPSVFVVHEHGINRLGDFLSKQRLWGRQSALRLDLRHSRRAAAPLAGWLKIAPVHFLLVAPLALASAVKAVWHNRRAGWKVLQYFPLIVAGKLMFRWGNFTASARGCAGEK